MELATGAMCGCGVIVCLLKLVGGKVSTEREVIDRRLLAAEIIDADLRIWHTTAVAGLDVWFVLLVTVALRRTAEEETVR